MAGESASTLHLFDVNMMGLPEFNGVYLVKGPEPVLVDAGTTDAATDLVGWLRSLGAAPRYVVVTHAHYDHIGGLDAVLHAFGRNHVTVLASPEGAKRLGAPNEANRIYGATGLAPVGDVRVVADGEELVAGGLRLTFFDTPGHSADSISVLDHATDTLFVGDLPGDHLWGDTFLPPNASEDFDEEAFLRSMQRMTKVGAARIALSHYGVFEGDDAQRLMVRQVERYEAWKQTLLEAYGTERSEDAVARRIREMLGTSRFASLAGFDTIAGAFASWCMAGYRNAGLSA